MENANLEIKNFVDSVLNDPTSRRELVKRSHLYFFCTYLSRYITYKTAPFHHEMFRITEDDDTKMAAICSFRGSGKSTLMTLSYPIWAVLGRPQKKFVVIISQTAEQAKLHFKNLKRELETNDLLKRDLGPFQEQDEWNACSLVIPKYNAKIIAVSKDQSFRGIKHGEHRPDLIIADDCENSDSVKTQESRDSTFNWFTSEVLPLGDKNTKKIIIGNLLHEDSLLKRLEDAILDGSRSGIFRQYPLLDDDDNIAWPGKYPDMKAIEEEKLNVGNIFAWMREYLLRIIDDREPVIDKNWIQYYDELPTILRNQGYSYVTGIDLAISEKDTADFSAMVTAKVIGSGDDRQIFILPHPVNRRMKFSEIIESAVDIYTVNEGRHSNKFYVEETMLQGYVTQQLKDQNIDAVGIGIRGKDKRTRLELSAPSIYNGKVWFPRSGCEDLLKQLLKFGVEKHDDLVDAFTTLILGIIDKPPCNFSGRIIIKGSIYDWARRSSSGSCGGGMGPGHSSSIQFGSDGIPYSRY
jgi:predicted phage terminase large subunit-like protein